MANVNVASTQPTNDIVLNIKCQICESEHDIFIVGKVPFTENTYNVKCRNCKTQYQTVIDMVVKNEQINFVTLGRRVIDLDTIFNTMYRPYLAPSSEELYTINTRESSLKILNRIIEIIRELKLSNHIKDENALMRDVYVKQWGDKPARLEDVKVQFNCLNFKFIFNYNGDLEECTFRGIKYTYEELTSIVVLGRNFKELDPEDLIFINNRFPDLGELVTKLFASKKL